MEDKAGLIVTMLHSEELGACKDEKEVKASRIENLDWGE